MTSPSTRVAPKNLVSIQSFVSRAGFFWKGGAASLAIIFAASVAIAFAVGDVYESETVLEFVDGESPPDNSAQSPEVQVRSAVLDPATIEKVARATGPVGVEGPDLQAEVERVRDSVQVRVREDKKFLIAYRAETSAAAQRGSDWLAQAAMRYFEAKNDPFGEQASVQVKELEDKTRDLAAFVAEHPEVALNPPAPAAAASASGAKPTPPPADSALLVLQQQRATLEWRLADAEKKEASGNPYDSVTDRAGLQRMVAQVRAAIAARQAVTLRAAAESAGATADRGATPPPPESSALQAEWQRLVEAVIDAQVKAPSRREGAMPSVGLRIVQRASLPTRPIKPDRKLIALLGLAVGIWAGIIWAFARVVLKHDVGMSWDDPGDVEGGDGYQDPGEERGWRVEHSPHQPMSNRENARNSAPPVTAKQGTIQEALGTEGLAGLRAFPGGSSRPSGAGSFRIPKDLMATAAGVVDVSRVLAQTGMAPNHMPQAYAASIVDAPGRDEPPGPPHPAQSPARVTGVTQTFVSPIRHASQAPPAGQPPPQGASAFRPQASQETAPNYGLALRSRPPEDVFSLRDVPLGWSPDPSMLQSGSMRELMTLRDQLYRLAVNGCFVVGVTSAGGAASDKSCVAAQLASVVAAPGKARVLLMEANFDHPAVHRFMHIDVPFSQGFSEQMRRRMTAAQRTPWVLCRCAPNLHVLAEGLVRSPGLLSSVQFSEALSELRPFYDVIVADGPLAQGTVDTCAFDALTDGIVIVGAVGSVPSELLEDAAKWFGRKQLMAVISADASAEQRIEIRSQTT
jgi:Mrp family chromosome partitioning ATPase